MPYLGEDEHISDVKSAAMATSNSNTSDAEEIEMMVENKVSNVNRKSNGIFRCDESIFVIVMGVGS